jgi:hypothetical protein
MNRINLVSRAFVSGMPVLDDVRKIHMAVVASISAAAPNPFASPAKIEK